MMDTQSTKLFLRAVRFERLRGLAVEMDQQALGVTG
jgi:hypothetical protein